MLFSQACKTLIATGEVAALALVEDSSTLVRRQLELLVQAAYIARDSEETTRVGRAGMFLAFLWHKWPEDLRERIPVDERGLWSSLYREHGAKFTATRKMWGPTFKQMFEYVEQLDTYDEDYSHLSNVAHGGPPSLVHHYAQPVIRLHDDREIGGLLLYGSGYALGTAMIWNDIFHMADEAALVGLRDELLLVRNQRSDQRG